MWDSWVAYAVWFIGGWCLLDLLIVAVIWVCRTISAAANEGIDALENYDCHFTPAEIVALRDKVRL